MGDSQWFHIPYLDQTHLQDRLCCRCRNSGVFDNTLATWNVGSQYPLFPLYVFTIITAMYPTSFLWPALSRERRSAGRRGSFATL